MSPCVTENLWFTHSLISYFVMFVLFYGLSSHPNVLRRRVSISLLRKHLPTDLFPCKLSITTESEWHHSWNPHQMRVRTGNIPPSIRSFFHLIVHLSAAWRELTNGIWETCHAFLALELPSGREWKSRQLSSAVTRLTECDALLPSTPDTANHVEERKAVAFKSHYCHFSLRELAKRKTCQSINLKHKSDWRKDRRNGSVCSSNVWLYSQSVIIVYSISQTDRHPLLADFLPCRSLIMSL